MSESEKLNERRQVQLNMAILGDSSPMKSMFIGKLAGLECDDEPGSDVRSHYNNQNILFWNLNAVEKEPSIEDYLERINFERYDSFIIFRDQRGFSDADIDLAIEIGKRYKPVYFVKLANFEVLDSAESVKLDDKVDKVYTINPESAQTVISQLNSDIASSLKDQDKRHTFLLSIDPNSPEIIAQKSEILAQRSDKIAEKSSIYGTLISLPSLTIIADLVLLGSEIWLFRQQLGLDHQFIERIKTGAVEYYHKAMDVIHKSKYAAFLLLTELHEITGLIKNTLPLFVQSSFLDFLALLPLIGMVLTRRNSFYTTRQILLNILDEFARVANEIQQITSMGSESFTKKNGLAQMLQQEKMALPSRPQLTQS